MNSMIITELKPNEIFVFGSNKNGYHAGGAAKIALDSFGAIWGIANGFQGQSYAIPTLSKKMEKMPLISIQNQLEILVWIAERMPTVTFYLTDIGCGIAGFKIDELESILPKLPLNIITTWK